MYIDQGRVRIIDESVKERTDNEGGCHGRLLLCVQQIITDTRRCILFLARNSNESSLPGILDLPGGKVEPKDIIVHNPLATITRASHREIIQETGFSTKIIKLLGSYDNHLPWKCSARFFVTQSAQRSGTLLTYPTKEHSQAVRLSLQEIILNDTILTATKQFIKEHFCLER